MSEPTAVDALYLEAEHFALTAKDQPLEPRASVVSTGRPFPGLPSSVEGSDAYKDLLAAAMYGHSSSEARELINAFAHELAERQRAYAREVGIPLEDGDIVSAGDVIDLIDPSAGPVRPDEEPTT